MKTLFKEVNSMIEIISDTVFGQDNAPAPKPTNAVESIIKTFDRFPIVALGEIHWSITLHEFIASLIRDPAFANKVNDIVVEFGNAKYQPIMDRYIAGETVARTELQQVWRNTTQITLLWEAPIYEQFFATVRAVNEHLPGQKRLRVLLGDPPLDWEVIKTNEDTTPEMFDRDTHFISLVENEALGKGRKALLISGAGHMRRCCIERPTSVTSRIEIAHPGVVFVALPHQGFQERTEELEVGLISWPKPSLALVKDTWLGGLSADLITPVGYMKTSPDGPWVPIPSPFKGETIQDLTDAYLYLGPKASMQEDTLSPEVERDEAYKRELSRRLTIKTIN